MIKSMTGYGKAECTLGNDRYRVEIRSVNGKNADISIKTPFIPREKEMEVRQHIAQTLSRGSIDLFITVERSAENSAKTINADVVKSYLKQLESLSREAGVASPSPETLLPLALRMPDVFDTVSKELSPDEWDTLSDTIKRAVAGLDDFRTKEGESLKRDVLGQVDKIESYVAEVEKYEKERITAIREKILNRIAELGADPDENRLEQEIIYYIEKLDINEEKVRLRQHCRYFRETAENEPLPGKKLGFIAQEMGREINTMGSKANHAEIQKWVVRMKDELEKIKEQSLNIL